MMIELTSSPDKIDSFVDLVRPFGIKEMVRTGRVAMVRGTPSHAAETAFESLNRVIAAAERCQY